MNYLRPDIKRGNISTDEDDLIIRLHSLLGNRWSLIAGRLPGRTDNEIKNYWNSHLSKRLKNNEQQTIKINTATHKGAEKKNNRDDEIISKTKVMNKIHLPKPIRASSFPNLTRNNGFDIHGMVISGTSSPSQGERASDAEVFVAHSFWPELLNDVTVSGSEGENLLCVKDYNFENDPSRQNSFAAAEQDQDQDHNMLEKIYEEYQQLLKAEDHDRLDSFVQSLLV